MRGRNRGGNDLWRRLLLAFIVGVFAQASYLTQTYIHIPSLPDPDAALGQSDHGKSPLHDDPAHCPLCQEYLHSGAYLLPAPIVLPLPVLAAFQIVQFTRELAFVASFSHSWYGRAPPTN